MLVLCSNTISYYFRGDPQVVPCMQAMRPCALGVPAIVACQLRYALMLTRNVREFSRVTGLQCSNWHDDSSPLPP